MRNATRFFAIVGLCAPVHLLCLSSDTTSGADSLITNGDFLKWTKGLPDGWKVEIGAMNGGDSPTSEVKPIKGPALMLRGDASTLAWHSVSQSPSLDRGSTYRLAFQVRSENVRRQGRQHDNCYVGVMIFDANGERVGTSIKDLSRNSGWRRHQIEFKVPAGADKTDVIVFLSKTGTLTVKNLLLTKL